ncbi:MAG: hypothetical protein H0X64_13550, partial [Gemmatimonadaceae bacterium]|nr:hypothetical protein [Gemmatimonadaceae bacterium]
MTTLTVGQIIHSFFTDYLPVIKGRRPSSIATYRDGMRLSSVPESGGEPTVITTASGNQELAHYAPLLLPDRRPLLPRRR